MSMKRFRVLPAVLLLCAMFSVPAFADYKPEYKLDIVPSITTGWGMGAQYFADLVKERSGGKINIKVYPNAQLTTGKQTNAFMLLRNGTIDFACAPLESTWMPSGNWNTAAYSSRLAASAATAASWV